MVLLAPPPGQPHLLSQQLCPHQARREGATLLVPLLGRGCLCLVYRLPSNPRLCASCCCCHAFTWGAGGQASALSVATSDLGSILGRGGGGEVAAQVTEEREGGLWCDYVP